MKLIRTVFYLALSFAVLTSPLSANPKSDGLSSGTAKGDMRTSGTKGYGGDTGTGPSTF